MVDSLFVRISVHSFNFQVHSDYTNNTIESIREHTVEIAPGHYIKIICFDLALIEDKLH